MCVALRCAQQHVNIKIAGTALARSCAALCTYQAHCLVIASIVNSKERYRGVQEAVPGEAAKKDGAEKLVKPAETEDEKEPRSLLERVKQQLCVWLVAGPTRQVNAHPSTACMCARISPSWCP